MGDFNRRPRGAVRSRHQEPRPRASELLDDLALRWFAGIAARARVSSWPSPGRDQPKEQLARGLLILGRKRLKGPLRRDPNSFSHPARSRIGIAGHRVALAQRPGFLEGVLQERQHALVLARLVEDALHQARRIECKSDFLRRLDDGALQLGTRHRCRAGPAASATAIGSPDGQSADRRSRRARWRRPQPARIALHSATSR